jgi:hypothetical protein
MAVGGEGRTILVVDGEPGDEGAVREAARAVEGCGPRLLVLLVPATVLDWAHLELGDDPNLVRHEIEWEQWRATTRMLAAAGVGAGYRMRQLRSRWALAELSAGLDGCETLIVSTSSRFVRRRLATLARKARVNPRLVH